MRILFFNYEYPPLGGGGGVVMAALARELAKRHQVTVVTSRAAGLPAESVDAGVRVIRVPVFFRSELAVANFPSMIAYVPMGLLRGLFMTLGRNFDVINTHFVVPSGPVGQLLSMWSGIPNVLSVHGGDLFDPSKSMSPHRHGWLRAPIRTMLKKADAVVGQSQDTVNHVAGIYGVNRDVEMIPLGIERPPQLPRTPRQYFGLPEDAFVLITIGRLVPRKSTEQLVKALASSGISNAHLLVVGDGPEAVQIRNAAAALNVQNRVHLAGQLSDEDKYRALATADIFASTSQHEGFGLVFLEAMAYGLPVICYDRGGQVDFLKTGETGHVVKLNDLDAFTGAIVDLHSSEQQREKIGSNNLRYVEEYFIDRCAQRYENLFDNVIATAAATK